MTHDKKFTYLVSCRPLQNNYKFYMSLKTSDYSFECRSGRIGSSGKTWNKTKSQWKTKYKQNTTTRKGYIDRSEYFDLVGAQQNDILKYDIDNKEIHDLIVYFVTASNTSIKNNYVLSDVLPNNKLFDTVQILIDNIRNELKINADIDDINNYYLDLISLSQRKISNVKTALFEPITNKQELQIAINVIENEQDLLDTLKTTVNSAKDKLQQIEDVNSNNDKFDILKSMGLSITKIDDTDKSKIIKIINESIDSHMTFKHAWKIENIAHQHEYNEYIKSANDKTTKLMWHGSNTSNYLSIIENSLLIRPTSAGWNGSMWDDGIYGASDWSKSMNYTDGGYYSNHNKTERNILLLFEFHIGKQLIKHSHDDSCYNISDEINNSDYDSVWAKKGDSLYRDEYIIYNPKQCTPKYIVEFE